MNKLTSLTLALLLTFPFYTNALAQEPVSMNMSVQNALIHSPLLRDKAASLNKSENLYKAAKSAYYPSIGLWAEGGFAQEKSDTATANGTFQDVVTIGQVGANLNVNIWDGGKTSALVRSEEANMTSSQYALIDSASTLALSTINAHADIFRYKQLISLATRNISEHRSILNILQKRLKDGLATRGEVDQVYGRLYQAEATLLGYQKGLFEAQTSYTRLTGLEVPENLEGPKNPSYIYTKSEDLEAISIENNFYLQKLIADIDIYQNNQKAISASSLPKFYASAGGSYANKDTSNTTNILDWSAMLNVEWELFNGGANKARSNAAKNEVVSAQYSYIEAKNALNQQVKSVFKHTTIAEEQAKLYSKASHSSRQARNNFQMQFELGRKDLLSILDAETASFTASVNNVIATTDAIIGHYHMHALAGTLLSTLDITNDINELIK